MAGVAILICLALLCVLFVLLRHEGEAKRDPERGALQEPLQNGIWRGVKRDAISVWKVVRRQ